MPALPQINALTGERTGPEDVLGGLGMEVGSKVRSVAIRGTYTIADILTPLGGATSIVLELSVKLASMEELWEWLERKRNDEKPIPELQVARSKNWRSH